MTLDIIDTDIVSEAGPLGAYCFRAAGAVEVVGKDRREISVVAVPYDEPATINEATRRYVETIDPKAFDGVQHRITGRSRVTVNREHDPARTIGKVTELNPRNAHGLTAVLKLTDTDLANETLALARDDVLSASVCFSTMVNGEHWNDDRTEKRVTRAYLHHIALVPEPAYQGAVVTAVRSAQLVDEQDVSSTPWLDLMRAQRSQAYYGVLLTP